MLGEQWISMGLVLESSCLRHSSERWRCSSRSSASSKVGEAFGADAVGDMPDQEQSVLDVRTIPAKMCTKRAAGDLLVEATDYSPRLPHEESSSFSLTDDLFFSCSRADERRCRLGGETSSESEEKRYLKRTKEDFP